MLVEGDYVVNEQKIITMTRLALYDKHEGTSDRAANDYFRHDYIYKKNLGTRLAVGFGSVLILAIYWMSVILVSEDLDIFEMDIQQHLLESVLFVLAMIAVYSLIGTIQGTREYYLIQKRLNQYQTNLRQLERMNERRRRPSPDDPRRRDRAERVRRDSDRLVRRERRRAELQEKEQRLDSMGTSSADRKDTHRRYGTDSDNT